MLEKLFPRRPVAALTLVAMTVALLVLAPAARAAIIQFAAQIDGPQANGCLGTGSPATGLGLFTLDTTTNTVSYNISATGARASPTSPPVAPSAPSST
jgi:uncharacterized membrane protein